LRSAAPIAFLICACGAKSDLLEEQAEAPPAAGNDAAADVASPDAPPVDVDPNSGCLALEPSTLVARSSRGETRAALRSFAVGDCIYNGRVWAEFAASDGTLTVSFAYASASTTADGRRYVNTEAVDSVAIVRWSGADTSYWERSNRVAVAVRRLEEQRTGAHVVDLTLELLGSDTVSEPIRIQGTFCDWAAYTC
jgi:hypothetical protein